MLSVSDRLGRMLLNCEDSPTPRPRSLPSSDVLHDLRVVQKKSYDEIAKTFGVTKQAVYLACRQAGLTQPRPRYSREIPWEVALEHANAYELSMLRQAVRLKNGQSLPGRRKQYVENWMRGLAEPQPGAPLGLVVDYDREWYARGFALVPRQPEDDPDWLISGRYTREMALQ